MGRKKIDKDTQNKPDVLTTHVPVSEGFCALVPTADLRAPDRYIAQSRFYFPRHWLFENSAWCEIGHNLFQVSDPKPTPVEEPQAPPKEMGQADIEHRWSESDVQQSALNLFSRLQLWADVHEALAVLGIGPHSGMKKLLSKEKRITPQDLQHALADAGLANKPQLFARLASVDWFGARAKRAAPKNERVEAIEEMRKLLAWTPMPQCLHLPVRFMGSLALNRTRTHLA